MTTSTSASPTAWPRASRVTPTTRRPASTAGPPCRGRTTTAPAPRRCTCRCTPTSSRWSSRPTCSCRPPRPARCCPQQVRLADAAANSARAALLTHALGTAPEHLLAATREWLHQEARRSSYAGSMALVDALRAAGHAAVDLRRRAVGARAGPARPGRRGARVRRCRLAGADARHPAARRARRGALARLTDPPTSGPPTVRRSGLATTPRCYSGPCDRSRCRVSPVACRESPSTIWAAGQPCAAAPTWAPNDRPYRGHPRARGRILRDRHHHTRGDVGHQPAPLRSTDRHAARRAPGARVEHGHQRHRQDAQGRPGRRHQGAPERRERPGQHR